MIRSEYLSAGTDVVFPYTSFRAVSSDGLVIGDGDPNELLDSLLERVFTRITSLESLVANLTTQVNDLRNQLASLHVPEITEHFTLYLYTYTDNADIYPSDAAGDDNSALFDSNGEVHEEDELNSNGWFTSAEKAADAGSENEAPGIWGIKLEVSKRDGKYFIYPGIEDFKYDPQLTLVATFLKKVEDVKTELTDKIDIVNGMVDNVQSTINDAVTDAINAVDSSIITTAVNTTVNDTLTSMGVTTTNITKWNNFNSLVKEGIAGITPKTILDKLASTTEYEFIEGGVTKTRTAKDRLSELLFGSDTNDNVITADTYMLKTGLVKFKEAIAIDNILDTSNPEYNSFRNLVKQMVGLDSGNLVDVVANSSGSGGGVNMEALELAVMSDQDNAFKRALNKWKVSGLGMSATTDTMSTWKTAEITEAFIRQKAGCPIDALDTSGYKSVDSTIPTVGLIKAAVNTWQNEPGICIDPKIYTMVPDSTCG